MTILRDLLDENITAAHNVAGAGGSLFKGGVMRRDMKLSDAYRLDPTKVSVPNSNFSWRVLGEMMDSNLKGQSPESSFDPADVLSKLRDAEKQVDTEEDTVPFGMEDEEGKVIKVYVRADQADEFESALGSMLAGEDEEGDDDDEIDGMEIAEVLFKLKDKFDIVDVEWPEIEGDEEEEQEMAPQGGMGGMPGEGGEAAPGEGGEMGGPGGEMGAEGGEGMEDLEGEGGEGEDEMDMEAEGGAESTLTQVIDMMKKDAEARAAEAEAKAAEARAREAEANANAASAKVKQEEQVMDAEAHEKEQKAQKTEVDNLSKIARMKHDQATQHEASLAAEEDEEEIIRQRMLDQDRGSRPISIQKLAAELLHRLRAQGNN